MKLSTIHSPSTASSGLFDIGILLPAYKEWALPFYCLNEWLNAVSELEKKYRVLIFILVNWPSPDIDWNQETLSLWGTLSGILRHKRNKLVPDSEEIENLFDLINLKVRKNRDRIKIVLWSYHDPKNTIWMARHKWCSYLKKNTSPSWIIISTDSDSEPSWTNYLQNAIKLFENSPDISWATGGFIWNFDMANASYRTRQLHTYEKICSSLYTALIGHHFETDDIKDISNLTLMPGSNTIFRAWLYSDIAHFSGNHWTWEDMDFSRQLLEAGKRVLHDPNICISSLYRPSDRTEYGFWTELSIVNNSEAFSIIHPQAEIWNISLYYIFDHVSSLEIQDNSSKTDYLIQCLKDEFGEDIMDIETCKRLRIEIKSGVWFLVGQVRLNDAAIRIVKDRLSSYYWRLSEKDAYGWILKFIIGRLYSPWESYDINFIYVLFFNELEKISTFDMDMGTCDVDIWDWKVFLEYILQKIQVILYSRKKDTYKSKLPEIIMVPGISIWSVKVVEVFL